MPESEKDKFFQELDRNRAKPAREMGTKPVEFQMRQRDENGLDPFEKGTPQDDIFLP